MDAKRKIAVVTGTRAEYGLLFWLMKDITADPALELQVVVTGAHLSPEFGLTYRGIEADGFECAAKVEMLMSSDSVVGVTKSIGIATMGFADAFDRLRPDLVVLLGDRFEILAAAQAAMVARIPIGHIHGGEATEGAIDDAIRHAVTKLSHLHFTAAAPYRQRVIQMGEAPERVFDFGAVGVDNIHRLQLLDRPAVEAAIGMPLGAPTFLVTYHPVTLSAEGPERALAELFRALDSFPQAHLLFTKPNADTGGRIISTMIDDYVRQREAPAVAHTSLGQLRYLSALKYVDAVIGNSSSALIEAPALRRASVNIGERQRGRLTASSVLSCEEDAEQIEKTIARALTPEFQASLNRTLSPYGYGDTSRKIKEVLASASIEDLVRKKFHDSR